MDTLQPPSVSLQVSEHLSLALGSTLNQDDSFSRPWVSNILKTFISSNITVWGPGLSYLSKGIPSYPIIKSLLHSPNPKDCEEMTVSMRTTPPITGLKRSVYTLCFLCPS